MEYRGAGSRHAYMYVRYLAVWPACDGHVNQSSIWIRYPYRLSPAWLGPTYGDVDSICRPAVCCVRTVQIEDQLAPLNYRVIAESYCLQDYPEMPHKSGQGYGIQGIPCSESLQAEYSDACAILYKAVSQSLDCKNSYTYIRRYIDHGHERSSGNISSQKHEQHGQNTEPVRRRRKMNHLPDSWLLRPCIKAIDIQVHQSNNHARNIKSLS